MSVPCEYETKIKLIITNSHCCLPLYYAGWQANRHSGGQYGEGKKKTIRGSDSAGSGKKKKKKKKGDMETDPQDPVAALVKILEGWAAGQERQAAEHAEQLELLRVQAGLQTQALLQLAGGGGNAKEKPPKIQSPKNVSGRRRPGIFGGVRGGS